MGFEINLVNTLEEALLLGPQSSTLYSLESHAHTQINKRLHMHYIHTYIHNHIYTHTHIHTYLHTHLKTQTHTTPKNKT